MQFKFTFITALFAASAIAAPAPSSQASCSQSVVAALNGATKQVSDLNSNLSGTTTAVSLVSFINTDKALVSTLSNKANLLSGNILSINAHAAISNLETATTNYLRPVVSNMPICGGSVQSELKVLESDINSVVAAF
ncbi:hypothetical protein N7490_012201 [Penicillium lividum]|nr:hypothetical protein N7490_012201 [Penicillium lividum]